LVILNFEIEFDFDFEFEFEFELLGNSWQFKITGGARELRMITLREAQLVTEGIICVFALALYACHKKVGLPVTAKFHGR